MNGITFQEYFSETPWIDRREMDSPQKLEAAMLERRVPLKFRKALKEWRKNGLVIMPQIAPHSLIDEYLRDFKEVQLRPRRFSATLRHESYGNTNSSHLKASDFDHPHYRMMDFHRESLAGKHLALLPEVIWFLRVLFCDRPVAMQTLTFKYGSEQGLHQDFSLVVAEKPAYLVGCWLALEDVSPDAGPLGYYPGSHRTALFDFGDGPIKRSEYCDDGTRQHFLLDQCRKIGSAPAIACLKKGDVLLWHGALVHEGTRVVNRSLSRYSLVTHYSAELAYRRDRRLAGAKPKKFRSGRGILYQLPNDLAVENIFPLSWQRPAKWRNEGLRFFARARRKFIDKTRQFFEATA